MWGWPWEGPAWQGEDVSPGCHPKDPNFSQYLSYGMSYASLQAERIPHCKMRRAEGKDQDGDGVLCAEKAVWKGPSATEESVHMPDRI